MLPHCYAAGYAHPLERSLPRKNKVQYAEPA
jgi:hypothetical protein